MPSLDIDAKEATRRLHENAAARWYPLFGEGADTDGRTAASRLSSGLFLPSVSAEFEVGRDDHLFAIGSCFARDMEVALQKEGFSVESLAPEFADFEVERPGSNPRGFVNKHNPFSVLNELRWALAGEPFPSDGLLEVKPGLWSDPYATSHLAPLPYPEARRRRELLTAVTRRIASCRVVFITLGLIEAWYDTSTGKYVNVMPRALPGDQRDRFRFHVFDFDQVREALDETRSVIRAYGHSDVQIVATVSPIPMKATFSGHDVVTANAHSKAVLRAAAAEWAAADDVHYFPAYEIVVNSNPQVVWQEDRRHVKGEVVRHIMSAFTTTHRSADESEPVAPRTKGLFRAASAFLSGR